MPEPTPHTPRAPHTHALCWACVAVTPQTVDGTCQTCRDRERAAREYNVRQEMMGARDGDSFLHHVSLGFVLGFLAAVLSVLYIVNHA